MAVVGLTSAERGQLIRVHPDDEIEVRLPENPTTGYRWQVDVEDPLLVPVGDTFELGAAGGIGGGGTRVLRFGVSGYQGTGRLALELVQPWEPDAPDAERFSVQVQVEP